MVPNASPPVGSPPTTISSSSTAFNHEPVTGARQRYLEAVMHPMPTLPRR